MASVVRALDKGDCPSAHLLSGFDTGSSNLKTEHKKFLREVAADILRIPTHQGTLIGRASRLGAERRNATLSRKRALAVAQFLYREGVAREQLTIEHVGEASPLSSEVNAADDRSVELRFRIPRTFHLVLVDVHYVRQARVLVETIRRSLQPLVQSAGRELTIERSIGLTQGDLTLTFSPEGHESRPCGLLFLGVEGGGLIYVGAHKDLRVCGGPVTDASGRMDYTPGIERVFEDDEPEFARAVANTALHEIGHMLAQLEHSPDPRDFMITGSPPRERRTRRYMREFFGGEKRFSDKDKPALICALRTGHYRGGMRVRSGR